jgi:N-acetylneuraminic acid mutarotase
MARTPPFRLTALAPAFLLVVSGLLFIPEPVLASVPQTFFDSATDGDGAPVAFGDSTFSRSINITFHAVDDGTVTGMECFLDGNPYFPCNGLLSANDLPVGHQYFFLRAYDDEGGHSNFATFRWDVIQVTSPAPLMNASLPSPRTLTSAVWDGHYAYIFGGSDLSQSLDEIVRYDPVNDTIRTMNATLPTPRAATMAIWDGNYAYIIGGFSNTEAGPAFLDDIVRYDPTLDVATPMNATLPHPIWSAGAEWDGSNAYIFGGSQDRSIIRYNPATDNVTLMDAQFGSIRRNPGVVSAGAYAYTFGGDDNDGKQWIIERYDSTADALSVMQAHLPSERDAMGAVWDGSHAYLMGGFSGSGLDNFVVLDQIVEFDPATDSAVIINITLPSGRYSMSAVWDGAMHAYLFGGREESGALLDDIVRFSPTSPGGGPDVLAPDTFVDSATDGDGDPVLAGNGTLSHSLDLAFHGSDAVGVAGFECSLDAAPFAECTTGETFLVTATGPHAIAVQARDAAGNTDPTPVEFAWIVFTPAEAIDDAVAYVEALFLAQGSEHSLTRLLDQAESRLASGTAKDTTVACNRLQTFIRLVENDRRRAILTDEEAGILTDSATATRTTIGC